MEEMKISSLKLKTSLANAFMANIGLAAALNIAQDKRLGGRILNAHDIQKLANITEEWADTLGPILRSLNNPAGILTDMFFDDYQSVREKVIDRGAELRLKHIDEIAAFGDVIKKIDEISKKS